ncbi:hypothetical protein K6V18_26535 [Ralstonia insidiosa]|uniref:hypothetical protein n=1 Tax=Ralstonia TaxID=48736 RepID=UPI000ACFF34E|nr:MULTISPECIES: hypothetical protein [Ralstonia]MBY4708595.1 hypothetical protein [Ralstonia insidiosa]
MPKFSNVGTSVTSRHAMPPGMPETLSNRKPRNIVTPRGRGARGYFPSRKSPKPLKYESLIECDVLRTLEIATLPKVLATQPCVLNLQDGDTTFRYTPDIEVETERARFFVEVKHTEFLDDADHAAKLRKIVQGMRSAGLVLVPILCRDVRENDLQRELEILIRERPAPRRYRGDIDAGVWDPFGRVVPSKEFSERWSEAKRICDELLRRLMRRDPDELFPVDSHR